MASCIPDPKDKAASKEPQCQPVAFTAGNYTVTYDGRCVTKRKRTGVVPDGWYERVRIEDGVIVEASQTSNAMTVIENPCAARGGGEVGDGSVVLSPDQCNLSSVDLSGTLLTRLNVLNGPFMQVFGCGSPTSPLNIDVDINAVKSEVLAGGTNYTGCGIEIRDGVISSFVDPILNITSNNPGLQIIRNGCDIELAVTAIAGSVAYTRPWCKAGANGGLLLRGYGVVYRGTGTSATVALFGIADNDLSGAPQPPTTFPSIQEAISWVDSNLPPC